jgi:CHAT domain-containing protein
VPTATLWDLTRNRHPRTDAVVLVAGPDLAAAEGEVASIAACYDDPIVFTGDDATVDRVLDAAPAARAVHFACHGRLRRDTAAFSSLRLADGPLTVHDLERLAPSAHHWILAACDLGSPGQLVGPELDGVLATLLLGGAGGVVAGVVAVPDLETSELMTRLHGALAAGAPLAHAVQTARTGIDTAEPAGFVASVAFSCYGGG